ncbi:MAG: HAMP domain-containing histidine kinase [candidate division Zixibacteria bacterium]|nr:HAMP domain-containing histidine kinase [candidate division Zixibacteria bacterium]
MERKWRYISRPSDLYIGKSTLLKTFLLLGIVVIAVVFIWYTFSVIDYLKEDTRSQVEKYVRLWQLAANSPTSGNELQFIFNEIIVKATFPIIVLDGDREPLYWRNVKGISDDDTTRSSYLEIKKKVEAMNRDNGEYPLYFGEGYVNYFYYGDSEVINRLKMMPFIEIGIVLAFMLVGIIGFQNIRRSEERHIWVGMAKETAHQLGTPISSLMGWLEMLEGDPETLPGESRKMLDETIDNMKIDITRLQKVAKRFGMIGSVPELEESDLNKIIEEVVEYYRRRLPFQGRGIRIDFNAGEVPRVQLNPELFSWVLENMIKNSLEAVDSKTGRIEIRTGPSFDNRGVIIELTDNGRGISNAAARKIFRAGFTTKKRGWGLGLTLVKRIVEEYHVGKIWLKTSRPGETVFEIMLPVRAKK